jgi:hypothetical protein
MGMTPTEKIARHASLEVWQNIRDHVKGSGNLAGQQILVAIRVLGWMDARLQWHGRGSWT